MTKPMTAADLTAALKELDDYLAHIGGCGDGNCIIVKPAGMHTNGGCHCPRDHIAMQRYAYAHNKFASAIRAISVDAAAMTHREARMLADLSALLERVRKASGGDRELDARIWAALHPDKTVLFDGGAVHPRRGAVYGKLRDFPLERWTDWEAIASLFGAPPVSASIDAAVALVERVLPGAFWSITAQRGSCFANVWQTTLHAETYDELGANPALAILAALINAKIAEAALLSVLDTGSGR